MLNHCSKGLCQDFILQLLTSIALGTQSQWVEMINNLWGLCFIPMHHKEVSLNQENGLYSGDIVPSVMWDCLNILISLLELGILQNCRIQVTKDNLMKKKHCKFKFSVSEVQSINQCITDNFLLLWFEWLNVRMEFIKNKSSIVNGVMTSIDLYLGMLGDLLTLDWRVQLISGRV